VKHHSFFASILVVLLINFALDMYVNLRIVTSKFSPSDWAVRVMIGAAVLSLMSGCAVLPIPFNPQNEQTNSNTAEGAWLVLDAVDTLQTVQIAKHPACYREADPIAAKLYGSDHPNVGRVIGTNLILALGHTMVTSWLDDEVARHEMLNDDSVGPWYVGRVVWHVVLIVGTGSAVAGNHSLGLGLTSANTCAAESRPAPPTTVLLH
jgi:hypothetical protein